MKHTCALCRHKPIVLTMRAASVFTTVHIGPGRLEEVRTFAVIVSRIQSSPGYVQSAPAQRKNTSNGGIWSMSMCESSSLVVIDQAQPLAASRGLAIDHEIFSTMIKWDQREIEADFGRIRFEIGVKIGPQRGKLPRYALLTEDQTSAYMPYSQNTSRARAWKRLLVKAFREVWAHLLVAFAPEPRIKSLWERRREISRLATKIPQGYWCTFEMRPSYCRTDEYRGVHLSPEALPDVVPVSASARLRSAPGEEVPTCVPGSEGRLAREHLPKRLVRRMLDVVSWLLPQRALPGLPAGAHDPYHYDLRGDKSSAAHEQVRFNAEKRVYTCHPTWETTSYDHYGNIIANDKIAARKETQQS